MNVRIWPIIGALAAGTALISQTAAPEHPGPTADGGFLLSTGWRIKAAGVQIPVDTFPMSQVLTPDQKYLLVLNGGYNPPSVSVIDVAAAKEIGRTPVPDGWLGLTMTKAGDRVYVGGGSRAAIYEFTLANGVLKPSRLFPIVADKDRKPEDFIGDVRLTPDGHLLYAADLYRDSVVVVNPQSGLVLSRFKTGRRPYRILFHPSGKSFYVSSWANGSVDQYDVNSGKLIARTLVAQHPTDMVWRDGDVDEHPQTKARLFVSASNTNGVYVLGASETGELSRLETINLAVSPRQPLGTTPSGLGLSGDGNNLYVALSDANAAAVVDITGPRGRVVGMVPAGPYPTAAFGLPGGRIGVLNGKGLPGPGGSVQFVDAASAEALRAYTREVTANSPYRDDRLDDPGIPANNPIRPNGPIKHVVYIVRENGTYDQMLGDMKEGNGDPALVSLGEKITPNLHKLAREFVLLDNFYVNADSSPEGQNWAMAAIAPDYTERLWQNSAAKRRNKSDFEGQEPANAPPAGYLWTNASQAGISVRNYGYFAENLPKADADGTQIASVHDGVLARVTDPDYRGWDPAYPDVDRAKAFQEEMQDFEKSGTMPQLLIMRMGNSSADNDQGLGMVVEAVSKSRFWKETAVFIVDSYTQGSQDHVDPHRAPAWVISPWVKRHAVNSMMYNQASVLRTIEIILGLHPMTTYDAGARPMFGLFGDQASVAPYERQ